MLRYVRRRLALRLALVVAGALGAALFLGAAPRAEAVEPSVPPWKTSGVRENNKTGWVAAKHGPFLTNGPTFGRFGSDRNNGDRTGITVAIEEAHVVNGAVSFEIVVQPLECNDTPSRCAVPQGESNHLYVSVVAFSCYHVLDRTTRQVWENGVPYREFGGGGGFALFSANYVHGGTYTMTPNFFGTGRCNAQTEKPIGLVLRITETHGGIAQRTTWLEYFAGREFTWGDRGPSLEECTLWFGDFYTPDWPERFDGKTPAEVGCERWNRDEDGTDFASVCRNPPAIEYYEVLGLSVAPVPETVGAWVGHYAECLFVPRAGLDHEGVTAALNDSPIGNLVTTATEVSAALGAAEGGNCGVILDGGSEHLSMKIDTCDIAGSDLWNGPRLLIGGVALVFATMAGINIISRGSIGDSMFGRDEGDDPS